ncbi:MAG: IS630 family transposase, partial [Methanothrix sp.]|nr:IS630 family transposase [Methanothrix sp.]
MGRKRLHEVSLKEGEREELESFIRKGKASARSLTRARILLLADEGWSDKEIVDV